MNLFKDADGVLETLKPGMTTRDLAENMCNPIWQATNSAAGGEMMIAIDEMEELATKALAEIQHALVAEFVLVLDSTDLARQQKLTEMMKLAIPPETNQELMGVLMKEGLGLGEGQETNPTIRRKL